MYLDILFYWLLLLRQLFTPGHEDLAGADQFDNTVGIQHTHKGVQLFRATRDLDDQGFTGKVNGLGLEVVAQLQDGRTGLFLYTDLD